MAERDDPITGLIAWPGFFAALPMRIGRELEAKRPVGLAIGDVDNLKEYVEGVRAVDAESFGHLAGNAVMARLGTIARSWLHARGPDHACVATFGGDEIVLVAQAESLDAFTGHVVGLRDALAAGLPRTVSFATTVIAPSQAPEEAVGEHWWRDFTVHAIGAVEQTLFQHKHLRRDDPKMLPGGFVAPASVPNERA